MYCVALKKILTENCKVDVSDFVRHKNFALEPALTLCLTCSCPIFFSPPKDFATLIQNLFCKPVFFYFFQVS